jgi:hypothetical protein
MAIEGTSTDMPAAGGAPRAAGTSVLLVSLAGAAALLALAAAWLWITRGSAILIGIGQAFCF